MNLIETKNKVSQSLGYEDWKELLKDQSSFTEHAFDLIVNNVSALRSAEKIKEALELAAERAELTDNGSSNYDAMSIDKQSILSLLPELLENLKKEI